MTPPRELAQQWSNEWWDQRNESPIGELLFVTTKAAQWGFNQRGAVNETKLQKARDEELEACCAVIHALYGQYRADWLRSMRHPKPKSQAEEALKVLDDAMIGGHIITTSTAAPTIRAALERLRELEQSNG